MIAIIPYKGGPGVKSRLGGILSLPERQWLAREMLNHVAATAAGTDLFTSVYVLTPSAADVPQGADYLPDLGRGLNREVKGAMRAVTALHASPVLIIHADLPRLTKQALEYFIASVSGTDIAIAPDCAGSGTNALFVNRSIVFKPAFGADSSPRHYAAATDAGLSVRTLTIPALSFDVDSPEDYHQLTAGRMRAETLGER